MSEVFGSRLYRTSYLVIPRLALEAMPTEWQERLEALLKEADDTGLQTPAYSVFRDVTSGNPDGIAGCKQVNAGAWRSKPFYRLTGGRDDPWADYRRGDAWELSGLDGPQVKEQPCEACGGNGYRGCIAAEVVDWCECVAGVKADSNGAS